MRHLFKTKEYKNDVKTSRLIFVEMNMYYKDLSVK